MKAQETPANTVTAHLWMAVERRKEYQVTRGELLSACSALESLCPHGVPTSSMPKEGEVSKSIFLLFQIASEMFWGLRLLQPSFAVFVGGQKLDGFAIATGGNA